MAQKTLLHPALSASDSGLTQGPFLRLNFSLTELEQSDMPDLLIWRRGLRTQRSFSGGLRSHSGGQREPGYI